MYPYFLLLAQYVLHIEFEDDTRIALLIEN